MGSGAIRSAYGVACFRVVNDEIVFQRGYWDKLSFLPAHGLQIP